MEQQNVTVSLPSDLLREAKHLAVDQGMSLSKFVSMLVEERVETARHYRVARERQARFLKTGFDLGTDGNIDWKRDQLHER